MNARAIAWSPGAAGPLLADDDRWWRRAACLGADTAIFFPRSGASSRTISAAKAFCARCPVKADCLDEALRTADTDSVRGGMTGPERRGALSLRARPATPLCPKRIHVMDDPNTGAAGRCLACHRTSEKRRTEERRAALTGDPTPRQGRRLAA